MQSKGFTNRKHRFYFSPAHFFWLKMIAIAALLTGCRNRQIDHPLPPPGSEAGTVVVENETFETDFGNYPAEYGTIVVPENRRKPGSRVLKLYFIRIHAKRPAQKEPIFYLSGGPGASNLTFQPFEPLLQDRDFVMVGYRGIDDSTPLMCFDVQQAMSGQKDGLGAATRNALAKAFSKCAGELAGQGFDLASYTIRDVIEDVEAVRNALGYEKINLLSESYGTRIAYFYGLKYPQSLRRSVMLGANPPGRFIFEAEKIDEQLTYYGKLWAEDKNNPNRRIDLVATMRNVLQNMPGRWLIFPIDAGKVKMATFLMLYHRQSAAMIFDAYLAAAGGDASGLAVLTFAYDMLVPSALNYADAAAKAVSVDFDSTRNFAAEKISENSVLGSPHAQLLWGSIQASDWPKKTLPEEYTRARRSEVETLILSGSIDFSTPAEYATTELLPYLPNGKQIILAEMGHTADLWSLSHAATIRTITHFYDTGGVDESLKKYIPMEFSVGLGFPGAAKLAIGVIVFGLLVVIALLAFLIFRIRQG
jgi:pimeloyl-ACP methyl ester carboxylesterase